MEWAWRRFMNPIIEGSRAERQEKRQRGASWFAESVARRYRSEATRRRSSIAGCVLGIYGSGPLPSEPAKRREPRAHFDCKQLPSRSTLALNAPELGSLGQRLPWKDLLRRTGQSWVLRGIDSRSAAWATLTFRIAASPSMSEMKRSTNTTRSTPKRAWRRSGRFVRHETGGRPEPGTL